MHKNSILGSEPETLLIGNDKYGYHSFVMESKSATIRLILSSDITTHQMSILRLRDLKQLCGN